MYGICVVTTLSCLSARTKRANDAGQASLKRGARLARKVSKAVKRRTRPCALQNSDEKGNVFNGGILKSNITLFVDERKSSAVVNVVGLGAVLGGAAFSLLHSADGVNVWEAYQTAVRINPIETKACISGVVYSLGDLIAQSYEGREISEWDRGRVIRSGLCGLLAHGPLSHLYYVGLDKIFANQHVIDVDSWVSPLVKVGIDQTIWSLFWNSLYYILLGILKAESPRVIISSVRQSWWDLLKAGWRLWPFVHICTYGIIPVQHRLLFVDTVELLWVCILSTYGQQQRVARQEASEIPTWVACALPSQAGEGGNFSEEILRGMDVQQEIVIETADGTTTVLTPEEVYEEEKGIVSDNELVSPRIVGSTEMSFGHIKEELYIFFDWYEDFAIVSFRRLKSFKFFRKSHLYCNLQVPVHRPRLC